MVSCPAKSPLKHYRVEISATDIALDENSASAKSWTRSHDFPLGEISRRRDLVKCKIMAEISAKI